jgi:hypothetical protein
MFRPVAGATLSWRSEQFEQTILIVREHGNPYRFADVIRDDRLERKWMLTGSDPLQWTR